MCMTNVKQFETIGYKVFACDKGQLSAPCMVYKFDLNYWNFANIRQVGTYLHGFHVFLDKEAAINYVDGKKEVVHEVEYKGVLASGIDGYLSLPGRTVSVAAIRILGKIPKRKKKTKCSS